MALELQGRVGLGSGADGIPDQVRLGRELDLIVSDWLPRYGELARRGKLYTGMMAVAGADHGSSVGTSPIISLANPTRSRKIILPVIVTMGYISGTLGAGVMVHCVNAPGDTQTSGTAITPYNSQGLSPAGTLKTSATLSAAPAVVRPSFSLAPALATTAMAPWLAKDEVNGEIPLEPGAIWSLQGVAGAAGTTPRVVIGVTWIEVDQ